MEIKVHISAENADKLKEALDKLAPLESYGDIHVECTLLDSPRYDRLTGKIERPNV
ncbi:MULTISPECIES: hypothetical protein [Limosilactobacillus]|jgi:hypothetical protein|uniref:hypothetical protein n=1 Tax=Limosilactobacillus TaxID=2742598 RepID=UPI001F5AB7ED|nr:MULTISPECIES: hypothetical protein [Limosilactobacillus]MDP8002320.1 hypothetical protein [Enterococcus faecium]UNL61956.1 hypothetical protein G8B17_06710 [Limosilactobacillus mucosae]URL82934.1 hypothetical protein LT982_00545 [Limosilactobacillus fermentum]